MDPEPEAEVIGIFQIEPVQSRRGLSRDWKTGIDEKMPRFRGLQERAGARHHGADLALQAGIHRLAASRAATGSQRLRNSDVIFTQPLFLRD